MNPERTQGDIARVATRLARHVDIALGTVDLSLAQYRVLYQLAEGTVASSSLATQIAVSPPSITNVVEGLVQRGLVQREHSANDRRRVSLTLTTTGTALLHEAEFAVEKRLTDIAGEVEDPEYTEKAIGGLVIWRRAIEVHRKARMEERSRKMKVASQ